MVNETLASIKYFEGLLKEKENSLQDIEVIKKKLQKIVVELDSLKKYENHIIKINKQFCEDLDKRIELLRKANIEHITKQKNQFITLVTHNLPDGIKLKESDREDTWNIVLSDKEYKTVEEILKTKKQNINNVKIDKVIGEMLLKISEKFLVIRIMLKDDTVSQEFEIEDPLKVLPIINHIANRYNYKEGIKIN